MLETDSNKNIKAKYIRDTSGKALALELPTPDSGLRTYYYLYNAHGDVTGLTDSSGTIVSTYSYDEFGNQLFDNRNSIIDNIYNPLRYAAGFNAYYDEESGFYHIGTRYYDPSIGRWARRDVYQGDQQEPISQNRYIYCKNNPVSEVDPQGFMSDSIRKALGKSRPGHIILTKYKDSWYGGWATYWTHSMMRVNNGKGRKKKKGGYARIAEITLTPGRPVIKAMYSTFDERDYNEIQVLKVKSKYTSKAIGTMQSYAGRLIGYSLMSNYTTFLDGSNCAELVWSAWYQGSDGKVNMNDKGYLGPNGWFLVPDTFKPSYGKTQNVARGRK